MGIKPGAAVFLRRLIPSFHPSSHLGGLILYLLLPESGTSSHLVCIMGLYLLFFFFSPVLQSAVMFSYVIRYRSYSVVHFHLLVIVALSVIQLLTTG